MVRYGAIGDLIQTSSVLPGLKEQGYHVTLYTVPDGEYLLKNDPHIDRFVVQDVDAIRNEDLGDFWNYLVPKYTKFVNLSESVERTLLAMPGNMNHTWSHKVRHKVLNRNYLEFMHDLADVPLPPRTKFYATEAEHSWARLARQQHGGDFVVMCVLAGSALHKMWPHIDELFNGIFERHPNARIVTVGDKQCQLLEHGMEKEPRIHRRAGRWTLRQSITYAQYADCVVGPETGVMSAVSMEPVGKVVFLSHSSPENLTRDWVNTIALEPKGADCYPCHRLHLLEQGWTFCKEAPDNKGVALCQQQISPAAALAAVEEFVNKKNRMAA